VILQPVMAADLYLPSLAALVDVLLGHVARELLAVRELSANETKLLHQLLQSLLDRLQPLLAAAPPTTDLATLCPQWARVVAIDRVLTIRCAATFFASAALMLVLTLTCLTRSGTA
jgi:hypothetical protein